MKRVINSFIIKAFVWSLSAIILVAAAAPATALGASETQHENTNDVVQTYNKKKAYDGYTLFAPNHGKTTYLVDNKGRVRHTWTSEHYPGSSVYLLENGNLVRTKAVESSVFTAGGTGGGVEILDWDSNVVWSYELASNTQIQHHDVSVMPNGNIMLLAWEVIPRDEAIAAGVDPANIDPASNSTWAEFVVEVDPDTNQTVWEWHAWDHLVQDHDPTKANYGDIQDNPRLINANYYKYSTKPDWTHANAVDYNADLDQIMISAREFNEVWIVDHSTTTAEAASHTGGQSGHGGDLLFRWGNPEAHGAGTEQDRKLFLQHDTQWIDDGLHGKGNILIFNNGDADAGRPYSSVLEIKPILTGRGYLKDRRGMFFAKPMWEYTAPDKTSMFGPFISGAQRLPNGNTLICVGPSGTFIEVTRQGKVVWKFVSPVSNPDRRNPGSESKAIFRATKLPTDYPAFRGKELPPQGIIQDD